MVSEIGLLPLPHLLRKEQPQLAQYFTKSMVVERVDRVVQKGSLLRG
jgi:hypothetical protein